MTSRLSNHTYRPTVPARHVTIRTMRNLIAQRQYHTARCILKSGDRFLLAIHNNIRLENHGKWGLPGGRVEFGENPETTARRELAEELGVQLEALRFVGDYEYKGRMHKVFGSEFEGDIVSFDQNEILEIGWHSLAQVRTFEEDGKLHTGFEHIAIREYIQLID